MGNINELIPAFSLGCLDYETQKHILDLLKSGSDLNLQELGELQNLVALLPSTLVMEHPGTEVKQNVARKLYKIRNEVLKLRKASSVKKNEPVEESKPEVSKISEPEPKPEVHIIEKEQQPETNIVENEQEPAINISEIKDQEPEIELEVNPGTDIREIEIEPEAEISSPEPEADPEPETYVDETEFDNDSGYREKKIEFLSPHREKEYLRPPYKTPVRKEPGKRQPSTSSEERGLNSSEEFQPVIHHENKANYYFPSEKEAETKRNYALIIGLIILSAVSIAAAIYAYMNKTSDVEEFQGEVERLKNEVNSLTLQLSTSKEIQKLFNSPNLTVINLQGTEINRDGFGKVIINSDKTSGYIQLANMPVLPGNMLYQLWINVSGNPLPLGNFRPEQGIAYYSFRLPKISDQDSTRFFVTEEPESGSTSPGEKVYLTGR